jgi:hypothetical protein
LRTAQQRNPRVPTIAFLIHPNDDNRKASRSTHGSPFLIELRINMVSCGHRLDYETLDSIDEV